MAKCTYEHEQGLWLDTVVNAHIWCWFGGKIVTMNTLLYLLKQEEGVGDVV